MKVVVNYLATLNTRERWILIGGAIATFIIVFYAFVWAPWHDALARLRVQVPGQQETLVWMQREASAVQPYLKRAKRQTGKPRLPLLTVIEQTANARRLRDVIRQMQPGEGDQVRVWLRDAAFDPWLLWTDDLRKQGIEIVAATVNKSQQENRVNIRVTLSRTD